MSDTYEIGDLRKQRKELLRMWVNRIVTAVDPEGEVVPIEATWALVVHPTDANSVERCIGFVPCGAYRNRTRPFVNEMGAIEDARVVCDVNHVGPPKLYGAGEYKLRIRDAQVKDAA